MEKGTVNINGQHIGKDEKVLVERGGKFELVHASKMKAMFPPVDEHEKKASKQKKKGAGKPKKPSTAPHKSAKSKSSKQSKRPATTQPRGRGQNNNTNSIQSPYAMSPEMKKMMRKLAAAQEAKRREEEEQNRLSDEEARREAELAWKAWLEKKNKEAKQERTNKVELKDDSAKQKQEAIRAYNSWIRTKAVQIRKERLESQQSQIEHDEGFYLRQRKDCNKAFHRWLKNKNKSEEQEKLKETSARKQTRSEARHAKRAQNLIKMIQEFQQKSYIEYYGYRF